MVKFNASGVRQWSTYYGGSGNDFGNSCTIDSGGNVYLVGYTGSTSGTVMATAGSHQSIYGGGTNDGFFVKFDGAGIRQWATYYGGTGDDYIYFCTTDAAGNPYLAGTSGTNSGTIIATLGSHQSTNGGGMWDAFLVKFDGAGLRQWGTYYGGSGNDWGNSCNIDAMNNVYLAGYCDSNTGTVIATTSSHQSVFGGGADAYLVKFNSAGVRQWGTYYGGTGGDTGNFCVTSANGNVYLSGYTSSNTTTMIATTGSHQITFGGGQDAFLVQFNSAGVRQWGTYYGGANIDGSFSCDTDGSGNIYLLGRTDVNTGTVIATVGSHQSLYGGGVYDAFLVKFNVTGIRQWGTYYGGAGNDYGYACSTDPSGNVYIAGNTPSNTSTLIATTGSHQSSYGGSGDAFLAKLECSVLNPSITVNNPVCVGSNLSFSSSVSYTSVVNYNWSGPSSFTSAILNPSVSNVNALNAGSYSLSVDDGYGCNETTNIIITVNPLPTVLVNSGAICSGNSFTITPTGAITYSYSSGSAINNPTITSSYSVTGTDVNGCSNTAISSVTINPLPTINATSSTSLLCTGQTATLTANGATTYTWNTTATTSVISVSPTVTTTYTVNGTSTSGCSNSASITQSVSLCTGLAIQSGVEAQSISIFPNPTNGFLNVHISTTLNATSYIQILNVLGQIVLTTNIQNQTTQLNISDLKNGLYFVKVLEGNKVIATQKIIKE